MNKTGYITDPFYLKHENEPHPENPGRLTAIKSKLESSKFYNNLALIQPRKATVEDIARVHDRGYIESVEQSCQNGIRNLDADTVISPRFLPGGLAYRRSRAGSAGQNFRRHS